MIVQRGEFCQLSAEKLRCQKLVGVGTAGNWLLSSEFRPGVYGVLRKGGDSSPYFPISHGSSNPRSNRGIKLAG